MRRQSGVWSTSMSRRTMRGAARNSDEFSPRYGGHHFMHAPFEARALPSNPHGSPRSTSRAARHRRRADLAAASAAGVGGRLRRSVMPMRMPRLGFAGHAVRKRLASSRVHRPALGPIG